MDKQKRRAYIRPGASTHETGATPVLTLERQIGMHCNDSMTWGRRATLFARLERERKMAKGYIVARVTVTDPVAYAEYAKGAGEAMKIHGARVLARGGRHEALEGDARARNVILEFDSYEQARTYFHSPAYQAARKHREKAGTGEFVLVEGV
jgi:uncharacterized protein (DUF1330 family)